MRRILVAAPLVLLALSGRGAAQTPRAAAAPVAQAPETAYLDYLKAVNGDGPSAAIEPYLPDEALAQWRPLPDVARRGARHGLQMPDLVEFPVVTVTMKGDTAELALAAHVRPFAGPERGAPQAVKGTAVMVRTPRGWVVRSETWTRASGEAYWSGLAAPGVFPPELVKVDPLEWATADIRTVISAEAAYQSVNGGYYGTMECMAHPSGCIGDVPAGLQFVDPQIASAGTRLGFKRRFDPGGPAPATDVGPGKAGRSSLSSYAYWIIPDLPEGGHARCGDASGLICEMPDASAPATRGACPPPPACTPIH